MGRHSVPRGEKSTAGNANGSPGTPGYEGKHKATTELTDRGNPNLDSRARIAPYIPGRHSK